MPQQAATPSNLNFAGAGVKKQKKKQQSGRAGAGDVYKPSTIMPAPQQFARKASKTQLRNLLDGHNLSTKLLIVDKRQKVSSAR